MSKGKKIIVSVSNDLCSDQRLHKVCTSLSGFGYEVILLGRLLPGSPSLASRNYECHRMKLWFHKGPLFYLNYAISASYFLLKNSADIFLANDLDTLLPNFLISKIKKTKLVYDSHEYFTEVPELINRPVKQAVWKFLESQLLPRIKYAYTVSRRIAKAYLELYGIEMEVVRNFPKQISQLKTDRVENSLIYQGALNVERGLPELIQAMTFLPENVVLWIAGSGDIESELKGLVKSLNLSNNVLFFGRLNETDLRELTGRACLGLSLEKDAGLSYRYAVPNKIFDYIQSGVPVLYSPLPEVIELLSDYELGEVLRSHNPEEMALQISSILHSDKQKLWREQCTLAAKVYNWEHEEKTLIQIFERLEV